MEEFGDELLFCDNYSYPYLPSYGPSQPRPYRAGFLLSDNAHNNLQDLLLVFDFEGAVYSPYEVELSQDMFCIDEDLTPQTIEKLKQRWPLKSHSKRESFLNRVIRGYEKRIEPFDGGPGPYFTKREKRAMLNGDHNTSRTRVTALDEPASQMLLRMRGLDDISGRFLRMQ